MSDDVQMHEKIWTKLKNKRKVIFYFLMIQQTTTFLSIKKTSVLNFKRTKRLLEEFDIKRVTWRLTEDKSDWEVCIFLFQFFFSNC